LTFTSKEDPLSKLAWDAAGQRQYETGVDHGVLYIPNGVGAYVSGFAWNGLVSVTESPTGAEANPTYADNIKYLNLISLEQFGATVEAYTYPDEFAQCDGSASPEPGVMIGQQGRAVFGLCYRTRVGNDLNADAGYKLHLVWGAQAAPSEKAYQTVNDTPEALTFSWELSTTPVPVTGYKPTASMTFDSTKVSATALAALEDFLFGTVGTDPQLPYPDDVISLFTGTVTEVVPTPPTYVSGTHTLTIPAVTGVVYKINGATVAAGDIVITQDTVVTAVPAAGYSFPAVTDDDWFFDFV
jgi:hypothetical protein